MDIILYLKPGHTPAEYISELECLDVTWDDVDHPNPYYLEGTESVLLKIIVRATERGHVESYKIL